VAKIAPKGEVDAHRPPDDALAGAVTSLKSAGAGTNSTVPDYLSIFRACCLTVAWPTSKTRASDFRLLTTARRPRHD
jgi:hypothetical protein